MISLMAKETVICTYRVRGECEERFLALLGRHWRTLHELGFVTDDKPLAFRGGRPRWEFPHYEAASLPG
jgi:hypothetical protein